MLVASLLIYVLMGMIQQVNPEDGKWMSFQGFPPLF